MKKIKENKMYLFSLCIATLAVFSGCGGSGSGGSDEPASELYIKSAVYDNNRTATVADDTLYLYFNKSIDFEALLADKNVSDFFSVDGNGTIDSASVVDYNDTLFHRMKISLGSASEVFEIDNAQVSLVASALSGIDVSSYKTPVHIYRPMPKTGQSVLYIDYDDGFYQKGITRSYTDNGDGTVKDNVTGLVWEQEDDGVLYDWNSAKEYCSGLSKGSLTWRIPSIEELIYLMDRGKAGPAIDDLFTNVKSAYWSGNDYLLSSEDDAWTLNSALGNTNDPDKNVTNYVRCVSSQETNGISEVAYLRDATKQIVLDTSTNLVWQDDVTTIGDANKKSWSEAVAVCKDLTLDGKTDWRLPNLNELNSITDKTKVSPAMNVTFVNNDSRHYWSSTTDEANSSKAWYSYFGCGCNDVQDKTTTYNVRCVR